MKRLWLAACLLMVCFSIPAFSQETQCGDGVDNDGDGFVDCYDGDCRQNAVCKDFYIGQDKACQVPPAGNAAFGMKVEKKSADRTAFSSGRLAIGDLDIDGIPEVVSIHPDDKKIYILNGQTLATKYTGNITGTADPYEITIGDIQKDGCAEIFIAEIDNGKWYISQYDCKLVRQWRVQVYNEPFTFGLADFDADGKAELYYRNEIMDANNGTIIVKGSGSWNSNTTGVDAGSVAVDILSTTDCASCTGLELVVGGEIYSVKLGNRSANAGSLTSVRKIPNGAKYFPKYSTFGYINSMTSVVDYNQDGSLDVITSGSIDSPTGTTTVFFWDVKNNDYRTFAPITNWAHGTGRLNVADIDGDGKLNATFVSGGKLFALLEDFKLKWSIDINEQTSGFTGATVFDFNNDKSAEIVYRDEQYLYIIDGKNGVISTKVTCRSRTADEYPIVADVDADGSTEICITCNTDDNANVGDVSTRPSGQVRTYTSSLEAWVPARRVWNQHGYFNVNINDNLTVPVVQQKHHLSFSTGSPCNPGDNRPLNTYLNQSPFLDSKGCPTYAAPDIIFDPNTPFTIDSPTCPDKNFTVSFAIKNAGNLGVSGSIPITFYSGNPQQAGAVKLNTVNVTLTSLNIGTVFAINGLTVTGTGNPFVLYAVLNDNGSTVPTPISLPNNAGFTECNFTNNILSATVTPKPFQIVAEHTDNISCTGGTTIPNGTATAYRLVNGVKTTTNYTFYWYDGNTVGTIAQADYTGTTYSGLNPGTYAVFAVPTGFQCSSDETTTVVSSTSKTLSAAIVEDSPYSNCKNPNGKLHVVPEGGKPVGNYTYEWYDANDIGGVILSKSYELTNASAIKYAVQVTEKATGCVTIESASVTDKTVKPVVNATTTTANCLPANSGSAAANVGGTTNGHTFQWYIGNSVKPLVDNATPTYSNIAAGQYTVTATINTTGCVSLPKTVTVASKTMAAVTATVTAQQTSCTTPNGAATANVGGVTAGYTWKWFTGNNTLPANQIGTSFNINILAAGTVYTVQATDASGCTNTATVTVNNVPVTLTVTTSVTNQTKCTPFDGSVTATASGSSGVIQYYWFKGNIGTPDTTASTYKGGATYSALEAGYYTVVAVDKNTRCASATAVAQVIDNTTIPVITTTSVNVTSCTSANGSASASVGGVTAGYTFTWYTGSGTSGTVLYTGATTPSNLAPNTYTVKVVNNTTNCVNTAQVSITNNQVTPVVSASASPVTICTLPGNGSVTADVGGVTAGYTFYWFDGNVASPVIASASYTGATYSGRAAGYYTVVAVNTTTNCQSAKAVLQVMDNTVTPAIATTTANVTSCTTANGSASANVGGVTAGYSFSWYKGAGTASAVIYTTAATPAALDAGTYTVKVVSNTSGCSATAQVSITNSQVTPVVSASASPTTSCSALVNGSVTANVGGVTAGYTFYWFDGNVATPNIATPDFTGATYSNRAAGYYTVVAVNTTTNCQSAKAVVQVTDNAVLPAIATTTVNVTSCTTANGSASANVGGVTAGYSFSWYKGAGTASAVIYTTAATPAALDAGTYTVKVVNNTSGCSATAQVSITNSQVTPVVSASASPTTSCNALVNGSATANVGGVTAGYTFYWFNGNVATPNIATPDFTGATYSNRAAGYYTVVAVNTTTNCQSAKAVVQVTDNAVLPAIATTTVNVTSCTTANGSASANVGGVTAGYSFSWYKGAGTASAVIYTTAATPAALDAGTYTVKVVNDATGCSATAQVSITNSQVTPIVTASASPTTVCNTPANGAVTANVGGVTAGYTFYWFNGNVATPNIATPDFTGATYSNRAAGYYTVVAVNTTTNCQSAKAVVQVLDNTVLPAIATTTVNVTSCTTANGSASANVGGVTAGYSFSWYKGAGTASAVIYTTAATPAALDAGTYTVKVVNDATGCSATAQVSITNSQVTPVVSASASPTTSCNTFVNGSATANVGGVTAGYTFYWFNGNVATPNIATPDFTGATYSSLAAGYYTVVAVNATTNCQSAKAVVQVIDNAVLPAITTATTNVTSCITGNGSASANVGGVTAGYSFSWYKGAGTASTVIYTTAATPAALDAGTYTVKVVNDATGCLATAQVSITNNQVTPIVAASASPTTICNSPGNGSAAANVGGVTAGYTFYWFKGNVATPNIATPDFTGATYSNLDAGYYTVIAAHTALGCQSAKAVVQVLDNAVLPTITTSVVNITSCDAAHPNGSASANVGGVTAGYTFTWYTGSTATGTPFYTGATTLADRAVGTYTVKAVNNTTGCASTAQVSITNSQVTPVVTASAAPTTICNTPGNGSATADVGGVTAGYTFYWFNGNVASPNIASANATGITYSNLSVGYYTVIAVNNTTTCQSAKAVVQVLDNAVLPVITTVPTSVTSCDVAHPNGSASANVGGVTAGYTFTWYVGSTATGAPFHTGATTPSDRGAGTYTVKAVNDATGCTSTAQVSITNNQVTPIVSASASPMTICNLPANGSATADVGGVTAGYTFYWFKGNVTTPNIAAADYIGITYSSLGAGYYTVVAEHSVLKCQSAKAVVQVLDNTVLPTITTGTTSVTSCDIVNPNGSASANVGGVTAGYTFTWYVGTSATGAPFHTGATTLSDRKAGTYTVKAVNDATGCSSTAQVSITDAQVTPVLTASALPTTICNIPGNGSATANVGGVTAGYTFYWFKGNVAAPNIATPDYTGATYPNLSAAYYTVVAVNNTTTCQSARAVVQVLDNTVLPVVSATGTDNTACDPAKSNGTIAANVGGSTANHTFHIFSGQNTLAANEVAGSPAANVSGLPVGIYTIQAIDNVTGCAGTTEVTIQNNIVLPTISAIPTDVTSCAPPNGSITASTTIGSIGDYTFLWYNGPSLKATPDYAETTNVLTGIGAGVYTVSAVNNILGCDVQSPFTVTVKNAASTDITITQLLGERQIPAVCNDGAGQLGAQASSPVNVGGFTFSWYSGDKNVGMTLEGHGQDFPVNSNRISLAASLEAISSGLHTVIALDKTTGCQDSLIINLPYSDEAALLSILTFPQTDCAAPNGAFDATITPSLGTVAANPLIDQTWYEIRVYQQGNLILSTPGTLPSTVVGTLAAGNYTILAVETNPALPGCTSAPNDITILDATVHPVITANILTDNQNCTGALQGNGAIALAVDGAAPPAAGFSYAWYNGKLTSGTALPAGNVQAPGYTAINIFGGFYTVEVTNSTTGCKSDETFYINDTPYVISIPSTALDITDLTDCSPVNGAAEVTDVLIDGVSSGTGGFTFSWRLSDQSVIPASGNGPLMAPLAPGDYFVETINTLSQCPSSLVPFTIAPADTEPEITGQILANNTNCTFPGINPNGTITLEVNGNADPVTDFTVQWYEGNTTTVLLGTTTGSVDPLNALRAIELKAGSYTVKITDNTTPGKSCEQIATFTIQDTPPSIAIFDADIALTPQTDCSPENGTATVTDIIISGAAQGNTNNFTFEWFNNAAVSLSNSATPSIGNLAVGNYSVQATSTTTGCVSSITPFEIKADTVNADIQVASLVDNTNCVLPGNGDLVITLNGSTSAAGFDVTWVGLPAANVDATNPLHILNLAPGSYTVNVVDNTTPGKSCEQTATFTIQDTPPTIAVFTSDIDVTPQTDCSPENGTATVTDIVVNGVAQGNTNNFTFEWFDNASASMGTTGTSPTYNAGLAVGFYGVQATNTTTGCISPITPFEIKADTINADIQVASLVDNTNCVLPGNGDLVITLNGSTSAAGFDVTWVGLPAANVDATNPLHILNLAPGSYTVNVVDNTTPGKSCEQTATFTIQDTPPSIAIFTADIDVTPQTDCSPENGTATVTDIVVNGVAQGNTNNFTFDWFDAANAAMGSTGTSPTYNVGLAVGFYGVQATNTATGCVSPITPFEIKADTINADIQVASVVNNTNCVLPGNGDLVITLNGSTSATGFNVTWVGLPAANVDATNPLHILNLAPGNYTVNVVDNTTPGMSCEQTATFTILDTPPSITIDAVDITVTPQTDCSPENGTATVTDIIVNGVAQGNTNNFTFDWFDDANAAMGSTGTSPTYNVGLAVGFYGVQATNTTTGCVSPITPFEIKADTINADIQVASVVNNTNCVLPGNGDLVITLNGSTSATGFNVTWVGLPAANVDATNPLHILNLAPGNYTVNVVDNTTPGMSCEQTATFTILDTPPSITIDAVDITVTPQTDCSPENGTATVTDIIVNGVAQGNTNNFTFDWFDDANAAMGSTGTSPTYNVGLGVGFYGVQATNTTTGCVSPITPFEIKADTVNADIQVASVVNNTNCVLPGNGDLVITLNGSTSATGFNVTWVGLPAANVDATNPLHILNLAPGNYTVNVVDNTTPGMSCEQTATFTILDTPPSITIDAVDITVTPQTDCSPENGTATVTDIVVNGVAQGNTNNFTFEWFDNASASMGTTGTSPTYNAGLAVGFYGVQATNTTTGCISPITPFEIKADTINADIQVASVVNNTNCVLPGNGDLVITLNGSTSATGFNVTWVGLPAANVDATNPLHILNLAPGNYTVNVVDNTTPGMSCEQTATFTILDTPPSITIDAVDITVTPQTDCSPENGTATVTDIIVNGVAQGNTNNFTFDWFDDANAAMGSTGTSPTYNVGLGVGFYGVQATNTATGCVSPITPFEIKSDTINADIQVASVVNNTNCVLPGNGDLVITLNGSTSATGFNVTWVGLPAANVDATNPLHILNLAPGNYTVNVVDNTTPGMSCGQTATFTILDTPPSITIDAVDITVTPQTDCSPENGTATVTDIIVNGVAQGNTNNFTFEWFDNASASMGSTGTSPTYNVGLGVGFYGVQATNTATGCISPITPFEIKADTVNADIQVASVVNNTNCVLPGNGDLVITLNGSTSATGFNVTWVGLPAANVDATNPLHILNLAPGNYTVNVVDNTTPGMSCGQTATFTILDTPPSITIDAVDIAITPQTDCSPLNGAATVTDIIINGVAQGNANNFTFEWFPGGNTGAVATLANQASGDYSVQATSTTTGCISPIIPFNIPIDIERPTVVIVQTAPNIDCGVSPNGELSASVTEGSTTGVTAGYTFQWFPGKNNTNPLDQLGSGPVLSGLQEGYYTVLVTDTNAPNNNCETTSTIELRREIPSFLVTLSTTPQTLCSPVDGSVTLTTIAETIGGVTTTYSMSNPAHLARFNSFRWTDALGNVIAVPAKATSITQPAGAYFVEVTNDHGCTSTATMDIIEDHTVHPDVSLYSFANPAICIQPELPGNMVVVANNDPNALNITFNWYSGAVAIGVPTSTAAQLDGILYTAPDREFTVRVTDNITQCFTDATYKFNIDTLAIQTIASAIPVTSCVVQDGELFASTATGKGTLYTYDWYYDNKVDPVTGTLVSSPGTPFASGNQLINQAPRTYTAIAVHPTMPFCPILPDTAIINNAQIYPAVNITPIAPMTYCAPDRANGAARADVNGTIIGYVFNWFEGSLSNTPAYFTGSEATNLQAMTYFVTAEDEHTHCVGSNSIVILNDPLTIPMPQIEVLSNQTDCEKANGSLSAAVNGNTHDYTFQWYDGPSVKSQFDAEGEIYQYVYDGNYTVTATDRVSGCVSPPVSKPVLKLIVLPEFTIRTEPTACAEENGTAEIIILNNSDVAVVEWNVGGPPIPGFSIGQLPPGNYSVKVISSLNCSNSMDFTIKTDINVYNGISANNDGMNDFFEISCIEDYPTNNVRIFNRAGTLVYEHKGYNNQDVMFSGISNKGISVLGNELPEGTYFYIIDKGDGSEPKTGYLELLR